MAKNAKRISVNAYETVMNERYPNVTTADWFGNEVHIKKNISMEESLAFVSEIVDVCYNDSYGYLPEVFDFAVRMGILETYANFTMPKDTKKQYDFVYATNAVDFVMEYINRDQLRVLVEAANKKLDMRRESGIAEIREDLANAVARIDQIGDQMHGLFDGITEESLEAIKEIYSNGEIDVDKIVASYAKYLNGEKEE